MENVVYIPNQEVIYDEAGNWVAKLDKGLSKADELEFQKWLCANQDHYDVFMSMSKVFDGMDELSRLSDLFPEEELKAPSPTFGSRMAIAASTVLFAIVLTLVGTSMFTEEMISNRYETSVGEQSTVTLPDGSVLILNTNSLVTVDYTDYHRLITLERGEININVEHDKSRPLSVKAADKVVQAVGTAFNIQLIKDKQFELIVTQGKVRVGGRESFETELTDSAIENDQPRVIVRMPEESLSVSKGEKIIFGVVEHVQAEPIKLKAKEIEANLSWRRGNLIFDGQPLGEAIKEITRYTNVEFEFENEEIKDVKIAGLYKAGDVNGLLLALETAFEISSKKVSKEKISLFRETSNL